MAQITLNSTGVASDGALVLQSNGTTAAVTISTAQVATLAKDALVQGLTVGKGAGAVATNTALGVNALTANTTGANSVAIGYQALTSSTNPNFNTAVGSQSLYTNSTGGQQTAMGYQALYTSNAAFNTAFGYRAAYLTSSGQNNVAIGHSALQANTTASNNVAVGFQAGLANTTGTGIVAIGYSAMSANTTGNSNIAIGQQALGSNTTGSNNTAVGWQAAYTGTTASDNTAVGLQALFTSNGDGNTAVGLQAGYYHTTATNNTLVGWKAGISVNTGGSNVLIGYNAGVQTTALTTGIENVCIGTYAHTSSGAASNQIVIGNNGVGQGDNYVSIGKGGTNYIYNQFTVNATWTKASDQRIKKNIQDVAIGLDFINELSVKSYNWKPNNEYPEDILGYSEENTQNLTATMYGMIAQDVKAAMDKHGYEHFGGWDVRESDGLQGVSNEMFVLPLINAVKELSTQIETMKAEIALLKGV